MTTIGEAIAIAIDHHGAGRLAEAEGIYRQILAVDPRHVDALHLLGVIAQQVGRNDLALDLITQAIALKPDFPEAFSNLGNAYKDLGKFVEAETSYMAALALKPAFPNALYNLGTVHAELGRLDEAVAGFDAALAQLPDFADAHYNRANALRKLGRLEDAVEGYHRTIALRPKHADAYGNLGTVLYDMGLLDDSLTAYRRAAEIKPDHAYAQNGIGSVLYMQGDIDTALARFNRALALQSDQAQARVNRSLVHFIRGHLRDAWLDYEWRWNGLESYHGRPFPQPWWNGEALRGRELLIWGEQGLADQILGASMLPDAMKTAAHCVVECDRRLVDLLARSFPAATVIPSEVPPHPRALAGDYQIPMFGLGRMFRNDPRDFPPRPSYLAPDSARVAHWKAWLAGLGQGCKVGFSWRGRLMNRERPRHFAGIDNQSLLLGIPGCVFVNLQYDGFTEDIDLMYQRTGVVIHSPEGIDPTNDLDDVAALMAALDAVVGPATAVTDLAGAVGTPTWMYAYYPASNEKEICAFDHVPWCPGIRVETSGFGEDWTGALKRIAEDLGTFVRGRALEQEA